VSWLVALAALRDTGAESPLGYAHLPLFRTLWRSGRGQDGT